MPVQRLRIGDFDPSIPGGYDNVRSIPIQVKKGRSLLVRVESDSPVDVALSDAGGAVLKFEEGMRSGTLGPFPFEDKGTAVIMLGVYRGDKADVELEAWVE